MSRDAKARFRSVETQKRAKDPRTGTENPSIAKDVGPSGNFQTLIDPQLAAGLYHAEAWFSAGVDAIGTGVGSAEISPAFLSSDPNAKSDTKVLNQMANFLESDTQPETAGERMNAMSLDLDLQGYCGFEVTRGTDRKPAAWYHVPGATLRIRQDLSQFDQVDGGGNKVKTLYPYIPGGYDDGRAELVLIRKYDPTAIYAGSPAAPSLRTTLDRLSGQDAFNRKLLGKGGIPPLLLVLKEVLDDDSYQRLSIYLEGLNDGDESKPIGVLDGVGEGKVEKLIADQEDMAYVKAEEAMCQRILAKLHVPPTKVSKSASNYATAYQEDQTFKFEVTQPRLRIFLKRLTLVAREFAPAGYYFAFKQASLEDFYQLVQALALLLEKAVLTPNQVLARLGFPGLGPDGDEHIAFTNQGPVKLADLVAGNLPATPGRAVDALLQIRRMIEEANGVSRAPAHEG